MNVTIIDYGSGNLHSAEKSFERAARDSGLNANIVVTSDPDLVASADRIVLPGVGAFRDPKVWMKHSDTIEVEISGVGLLSNPVQNEEMGAA